MLRYPLDEIRGRTDIVELVSTYVNLKRSGKTLKALCPFHTEKTPSFIVNEDLQRWRCYGCSEHGDVFSFLMKMENMTFSEAVKELAKRAGVSIQQSPEESKQESDRERLLRLNGVAASYFSTMLRKSEPAMAYLRRREVSEEAITTYSLGYAPGEWRGLMGFLASKGVNIQDAEKAGLVIKSEKGSYYDRFRDRIIFPIQDVSGRITAFGGRSMGDEQPKYLNSPETAAFVKNRTLYGLNHARKSIAQKDRVIVVEGYLDALTAQCAGFDNTVATMGTALTPEHVNMLSRYTRNVVIAFDSDSAGMSATLRSAPMFEQADFNVRIVSMPSGSDPDSLLRSGDATTFSRLIEDATPLVEYRLEILKRNSDMTTDTGKAEMLKKAVAILSEVSSAVQRDQYVKELARYRMGARITSETNSDQDRYIRDLAQYHPTFAGGTARAEESIRRDVEAVRTRRAASTSGKQPPAAGTQETSKPAASGPALAEKYILKAIITDPDRASAVFEQLPSEEFATPEGRSLAGTMAMLASRENSASFLDELTEAVAGTPAANLLSDLTVSDTGPNNTDQAVQDCVNKLKASWKRQRVKELAARVERGELHSSDEEFAEYWRLVQELHKVL